MKINFTFGNDTKEGYDSYVPGTTIPLQHEAVEEIVGDNVLEKVKDLVAFINECYRLLPVGGKATFTSPYFTSSQAWASPLAVRAISEMSLSFSDATWREANKFSDAFVSANFDVAASFAVMRDTENRSDETRQFWMNKYNNVVQAIVFTLTKRP